VLLLVEGTGVEAVLVSEELESVVRHELLPRLTHREGEELGNVGLDGDGWLTNTEELFGQAVSFRQREPSPKMTRTEK
jgi:hypothetical protein